MEKYKSKSLALLIVLTAPLLSVIDVFIINVAIPTIKQGIQATDAELQLVIAGYLLGYASFLITGGRMGDHYGRKKVFIWGMFFFTLTSCLCGLSNTPLQLNIARFFQGISASFMVPQTIAYIQVLFQQPRARTKALACFGITLGIACIIGEFLGGFFSYYHFAIPGWRLIFFINLPVGVVSLLAALRYLTETEKHQTTRFDYSGVLLLTAALVCLIIPLIQGRELHWPFWIIALLLFSLLLIFIFYKDQKKKLQQNKALLINIQLFRFKDFNIGLLCLALVFIVNNSYLLISTIFLQSGLHINPFATGNAFVIYGLGFGISSVLATKVAAQYSKYQLLFGVSLMLLSLCMQVFSLSNASFGYNVLCLWLAVYGFGWGFVLPSLLNVSLRSVPVSFAGTASGLYSTFQQTASALGVSVIGGVFFSILGKQSTISAYVSAFQFANYLNIAGLAITCMFILALPKVAVSTEMHFAE